MSRFAIKISQEELFEKIFSALSKHEDFEQEEWDEALEWTKELNSFNSSELEFKLEKLGSFPFVLDLSPEMIKDLRKVSFNTENFSCVLDNDGDVYGYKLGGMQTLDNGFTFLGCAAGGDWEHPVFFIIYWDGKTLRGYVPKEGNIWDKKNKTAFDDDGDLHIVNDKEIEEDIKKRIIIK